MKTRIALIVALVFALAAPVVADWTPTDGWKMHFPQLPDLDNGMNVLAQEPKILADDFLCTETGLITDIHIWASWLNDQKAPLHIDTYIFKDIPAVFGADNQVTEHSRPGDLLWARHWHPEDIRIGAPIPNLEPFFDPNRNEFIGTDGLIFPYNFFIPDNEAFFQNEGEIYWLGVQRRILTSSDNATTFGWKSSADHWNDDAVWGDFDPGNNFPGATPPAAGSGGPTIGWHELIDPITGESMDLSFVITGHPIPEPATMTLAILGVGTLWGLRRRKRK